MANSNGTRKPAPSDALVEVTAGLIDEGKFLATLNREIQRGYRELRDYKEKTLDVKGRVVVTAVLELEYDAQATDTVAITHEVRMKVPTQKRSTFVKERAGKLLCELEGSSADNPDQMRLFSRQGVMLGSVDTRTGELVDDDESGDDSAPVAGAIGKAAAAL